MSPAEPRRPGQLIHRDIVVVGASAGGLEALETILSRLPAELAASVFVVVHVAPESPGYLAEILGRIGPLPAQIARDGESFGPGQILVAPADHHLLLDGDGHMRVTRGPRENRARPTVDPLFRSAALAFGKRVIGIVLSGGLDDGTAGLRGIKMCGGTTIVEDPADALVSAMPKNALQGVTIDYSRPARAIAPLVIELVNGSKVAEPPTGLEDAVNRRMELEVAIAKHGTGGGSPSQLACWPSWTRPLRAPSGIRFAPFTKARCCSRIWPSTGARTIRQHVTSSCGRRGPRTRALSACAGSPGRS